MISIDLTWTIFQTCDLSFGYWNFYCIEWVTCTSFQSWARDNTTATTWQCFQAKKLFIITICLYSLWLLRSDTAAFTFFEFVLVTEALFLLRFRVVVKLTLVACPALLCCTLNLLYSTHVSPWPATFSTCSSHVQDLRGVPGLRGGEEHGPGPGHSRGGMRLSSRIQGRTEAHSHQPMLFLTRISA